MCLPGQPPAQPATAAEAAAMARAGLGWLAAADAASLTAAEQADTLRALEQAASLHTAARARVLGAFHARGRVRGRRPRLDPDVAEMADPGDWRRGRRDDRVDAPAGRPPRGAGCASRRADL